MITKTTKTNKLSGFKVGILMSVLFYVIFLGLGVQQLFTGEELRFEWLFAGIGFVWMFSDQYRRMAILNEQD